MPFVEQKLLDKLRTLPDDGARESLKLVQIILNYLSDPDFMAPNH